jgi:molybdopterin-biosynthesis enzyme MoeA-like protein
LPLWIRDDTTTIQVSAYVRNLQRAVASFIDDCSKQPKRAARELSTNNHRHAHLMGGCNAIPSVFGFDVKKFGR